MARSQLRPTVKLRLPRNAMAQPGVALEPIPLWQPPKGLDYLNPLTRIEKEYSPQMTNIWLDRGVQRSRFGTSDMGGAITDLMAVLNFIDGNGVAYLLRFTTTKMQSWNGASWDDVFTSFTGSTNDYFTFTAFNNKLLLSNGIDGIFEYSFATGILTKIDGAPACRQLTTFDGRVLASNVLDPSTGSRIASRVVWSVKLNELIWPDTSGKTDEEKQGSGFEDMLNTPGGQIDEQRGIWPVTDTIALAVRSKSVWQVSVTGDFDKPFEFGRLYDNIGSDAPQSIDTVPGGIVGLFNDDVYVLSNSEVTAIGTRTKDHILAEASPIGHVTGMYDPLTKNYWLADQSFVYRYSFPDQGWSRHQYPFTIRQMMHTKSSVSGLTIDQLVGTIDGLTGTIDELVGSGVLIGNFFASTSGYVIKEDSAVTDDSDGAGGRVDSGIEIQTGALQYGMSLQRNQTLQAQLEYEAGETHPVAMEYSLDGGTTWTTYSITTLTTALRPQIMPFRHTIEAEVFQLRLTSNVLGRLKIIGLWPIGQRGAPVAL